MASGQLIYNRHLPNYYHILDKLGYTKALSEKRCQIADNAAKCWKKVFNRTYHESTDVIIPGSRGEGISVSGSSDMDLMIVQPAIQCFVSNADIDHDSYVATFQLEFDGVPDGYAKLKLGAIKQELTKLDKYGKLAGRVKNALTETNYSKNDGIFIEAIPRDDVEKGRGMLQGNMQFEKRAGPSRPTINRLPIVSKYLSVDYVAAFPCSFRSVFDGWSARERNGIWPTKDVQDEVKDTAVFVVPVGLAGHEEQSLQWRVSFTLAERLLVRSFNDTQLKVYVAMKMLKKTELKPICAGITSYVVKNVIFWAFEKRSGTFTKDDFNEILKEALERMKAYVDSGFVPNYILPSRNLLKQDITEEEKEQLTLCLDTLIEEGPSALARCPLISMFDQSEDELRKGLLFRELSDQVSLAIVSVDPDYYADELSHLLYDAPTVEEFIKIVELQLLPLIKKSNPFEFFNLLVEMKSEDIKKLLIIEGTQKLGLDKIWMD